MGEVERVVCNAHQIAMDHKQKPWSACVLALEDLKLEEESLGNAELFEDDEKINYAARRRGWYG